MPTNFDEKDLEKIIAVNIKSVEIQNHVASQYEEVKKNTSDIAVSVKKLEEKASAAEKKTEEISRELFQLKVLLISGVFSLIMQIIQIFLKK